MLPAPFGTCGPGRDGQRLGVSLLSSRMFQGPAMSRRGFARYLCRILTPAPMRRTFRYLAHVPSSRRRCCHDGPWGVLVPPLPAEEGAWALQEGDPALKRQSRESARAARSISERCSAQLGTVVVC